MSQSISSQSYPITIGGREEAVLSNIENPCIDECNEDPCSCQPEIKQTLVLKQDHGTESSHVNELTHLLNDMETIMASIQEKKTLYVSQRCLHSTDDIKSYRSMGGLISSDENVDHEKYYELLNNKNGRNEMNESPSDVTDISECISSASTVARTNRKIDSENATTLAVYSIDNSCDASSIQEESLIFDKDSNKENLKPIMEYHMNEKGMRESKDPSTKVMRKNKEKSENAIELSPLRRKLFLGVRENSFHTDLSRNTTDSVRRVNQLPSWKSRSLTTKDKPKKYRRYDDTNYDKPIAAISKNNESVSTEVREQKIARIPNETNEDINKNEPGRQGEKMIKAIDRHQLSTQGLSCASLFGDELDDFEDYEDPEFAENIEAFVDVQEQPAINKLCFFCG